MRPKAIKGAGALDYYAKLVPEQNGQELWERNQAAGLGAVEDYYLPLGETPGEWFGAGAHELGLEGDGHRDQMGALLEGLDPTTGEKLGQKPRTDGVRAYDLTFSAPKSVSVLAGIAGGETERQVIASHDAAVKAALGTLEERATTRTGKNGIHTVDAGGITSLLVRHRTSRSLDPQIHTHALVFAKVQSADGKWRALDGSIVFRAQRMFGAAYQSALRSEMTTRLGVEWGDVVKGQADLVGLDPELLEAFSTRSQQVSEAAERRLEAWRAEHPGREPTERERAIIVRDAARESRPAKDHSRASEELRVDHLAVAAEHGWDAERVSDDVLGRAVAQPLRAQVELGVEASIAGEVMVSLGRQRSVWSTEHVEREVLERLPYVEGRDAHAQLREAQRLAGEITAGSCIDLAELAGPGRDATPGELPILDSAGVERYTTRELLDQEQRIVRWFERAAAVGGEAADPEFLAAAESAGRLDAEQAQAAALVAGDGRAVVIVGPAGTGKTTTLKPAVEALHAGGRDVLGLAPTAVAAETLARDTGVAAENVAMFLTLHDSGNADQVALRPGGTLIIDEAGMLGTDDLERVLRIAGDQQLRVALVGDGRQLFAVGRGGMFDQARTVLPTVEFGQVYRFHADWERPASLLLRAGDTKAIDVYAEQGRVRAGTAEEINDAIVEDYFTARDAGLTSAFSAPTNEQAAHLNGMIRERLIASGAVDDEHALAVRGAQRVGVGDQIATRKNDRGLRSDRGVHVKNRHRWTVEAIAEDGSLTVSDPSRGNVELPADYAQENAELAYVRTTHGVQSLTQDVGGCLIDGNAGFRDAYVGMTRGRANNTAYVVVDPDNETTQFGVFAAALRRDRADLGVLAIRDRLADELRLERERQAEEQPPPGVDERQLLAPSARNEATGAPAVDVAVAAAPAGVPVASAIDATPVPAPATRFGLRVRDPLASRRSELGAERSELLAAKAAPLAARAIDQRRHRLVADRDAAAPAWDHLDSGGARETRNVQHDGAVALRTAADALASAQALEQQAAQTGGLRGRSQRHALEQQAAVQRRVASSEQQRADQLAGREAALHSSGRHLDAWMATHGDQAAAWLAAEHELAARREVDATAAARSAVLYPPEEVRAQIGDRPGPGDPHRGEWDDLAQRLEHDRLLDEAELADGSEPGRDPAEDRDVERRVRHLRDDLGLEPLGRAEDRDVGFDR